MENKQVKFNYYKLLQNFNNDNRNITNGTLSFVEGQNGALNDIYLGKDKWNNLRIGGRNLLSAFGPKTISGDNSDGINCTIIDESSLLFTRTDNNNDYSYIRIKLNEPLTSGPYVLSFLASDSRLTLTSFYLISEYYEIGRQQLTKIGKVGNYWYYQANLMLEESDFGQDEMGDLHYLNFYGYLTPEIPKGTEVEFRNIKFEKGNIATDWAPSLEILEANITDKVNTTIDNKVKPLTNSIFNLYVNGPSHGILRADSDGDIVLQSTDSIKVKASVGNKAGTLSKALFETTQGLLSLSRTNDNILLKGSSITTPVSTIDISDKADSSVVSSLKSTVDTLNTKLANCATKEDLKNLDINLFEVITGNLPSKGEKNKIYLVPSDNKTGTNSYKEFVYLVDQKKWEQIGEISTSVDLSDYTKTHDLPGVITNTVKDSFELQQLLKGDKGDRGIQGIQGERGPAGPAGPQGIQGKTGATGPKGDPGIKGDTGLTGERGPIGAKGDTGDKGADGHSPVVEVKDDKYIYVDGVRQQYLKGDKGDRGPAGAKGDTGQPGPQGVQGIQGKTGAMGPQGKPGDKGAPGDPATATKIKLSYDETVGRNNVVVNPSNNDNCITFISDASINFATFSNKQAGIENAISFSVDHRSKSKWGISSGSATSPQIIEPTGDNSSLTIKTKGQFHAAKGFFETSDARLKLVKSKLDTDKSISFIENVDSINYTLKADKSEKNQIGFIAQDVEEYYPELIEVDEKGYKSINYAKLSAILFPAVKELLKEVKELKAELETVKK